MMRCCLVALMLAPAPPKPLRATANLHKHQGAVPVPHHQINLAPAAPGRPIIAHRQLQARRLQMCQGLVLGIVAPLTRGGFFGSPWGGHGGWFFSKEIH